MRPLEPPREEKKHGMLLAGIIVVFVIIVIAAVAGYLYLQDQDNKQNQHLQDLRQAFTDQLNETARQYSLIASYPAITDKNYLDDYRHWIDGYEQLAGNYTQAVALLSSDAAAYQQQLTNGSEEDLNVSSACSDAMSKARAINSTTAGYEKAYATQQGLVNSVSTQFNGAVDQSNSLYGATQNCIHQGISNYGVLGGYHAFLKDVAKNITDYNNSLSDVQAAANAYYPYLKDGTVVNATISDLQSNLTSLNSQYATLQAKIQNLTIEYPDDPTINYDASKGFYLAQNFILHNNGWPMIVWDVTVHFTLIDKASGKVRSTADENVDISAELSSPHTVTMACDPKSTDDPLAAYTIQYTVSYEY